tara:strand:- start:1700 stop:2287 length:588 start_codon:yes stop_codon:yes gene_type:complete
MDLTVDSEIVAFLGMSLILCAFFLETQSIIHSKASSYLLLMASGSGILAIRAYAIEEWAFLILEVAWFLTAMAGFISRSKKQPLQGTKYSNSDTFRFRREKRSAQPSLIEESAGSVVPEHLYEKIHDPAIDEGSKEHIASQIKNKTWWADAAFQINMPDSYPASPQDNYDRVMDVVVERREMEFNRIQQEVKTFR